MGTVFSSAGTKTSMTAPFLMFLSSSSRILKTAQAFSTSVTNTTGNPAGTTSPACITTRVTSPVTGVRISDSPAKDDASATAPDALSAIAAAARFSCVRAPSVTAESFAFAAAKSSAAFFFCASASSRFCTLTSPSANNAATRS